MSDKAGKESQYIVSRPETSSDPPIGSERESRCDMGSNLYRVIPLLGNFSPCQENIISGTGSDREGGTH